MCSHQSHQPTTDFFHTSLKWSVCTQRKENLLKHGFLNLYYEETKNRMWNIFKGVKNICRKCWSRTFPNKGRLTLFISKTSSRLLGHKNRPVQYYSNILLHIVTLHNHICKCNLNYYIKYYIHCIHYFLWVKNVLSTLCSKLLQVTHSTSKSDKIPFYV